MTNEYDRPYLDGAQPPEYVQPPEHGQPPQYVEPPQYGQAPQYVEPPQYAPGGYVPYQPYPTSGFAIPVTAMPTGYGPYDPRMYENDPLTAGPGERFRGWWMRLWMTIRRSGRAVLPIVLLTLTLPALLVGAIELAGNAYLDRVGTHFGNVAIFEAGVVAGVILSAYPAAIGWAAAQWTLVQHAVGAPARLGDALRFGARRSLRIWGYLLLYGMMVLGGSCAFTIPGLYLAVAGALIVPAALFQRGSGAIGVSFSMVHRHFGAALGRLALLAVPLFLANGLGVAVAAFTGPADTLPVFAAAPLLTLQPGGIAAIVIALIKIPVEVLLITGVLLTYAQLRAKTWPTTSADLAVAMADAGPR